MKSGDEMLREAMKKAFIALTRKKALKWTS
jgi:hypothetical protein